MSEEQSQGDLKAGGEGEEFAEQSAGRDSATQKSKSAVAVESGAVAGSIGSASRVKSGSVTAVKSASVGGSVSAVKSVSIQSARKDNASKKSKSVVAVESGAVSGSIGSASRVKSGSVTAVKSASVGAVRSHSATPSRYGSAQQQESISSKSSEKTAKVSKSSLGAESSKTKQATPVASVSSKSVKRADSSKLLQEKISTFSGSRVPGIVVEETEEELEEEEVMEVFGVQGESAKLSASRERASAETLETSDQADHDIRTSGSSFVEMALRKSAQLTSSAIWSITAGGQVSGLMSTVVESVAHSHAALFADSARSLSPSAGSRRSTGVVETVSETEREEGRGPRSVWEDPDVLDVIGSMRLDALGENVISYREGSEEIPATQFDIEEAGEKQEKSVDQLGGSRDDIRSVIVEISPSVSVVTSFWPPEGPGSKPGIEDLEIQVTEESRVPSGADGQAKEEVAAKPKPSLIQPRGTSDISKLMCFTQKDDISSRELSSVFTSRTSSEVNLEPTEFIHVKFRLVTGQALKRIYRSELTFRETLCDLSEILCVDPETIQLFLKDKSLNLDANVWNVCGKHGAEVLVDADFCPGQIYCLIEKGIMSFDDDDALIYYLLRRLPCAYETKLRYVRPASAAKSVRRPSTFIPGLVDRPKPKGAVSDTLQRQQELVRCVKCIQSIFRCYLSKRTFGRKESVSPKLIKASPANEASCIRNALMKDVNLLTEEDFTVLYNLLEEWWQSEADAIKRKNSAAAKMALLFNLLLKEIDYMRYIELHRCKLKQQRRAARISGLMEKVKEWKTLTMWDRVELLPLLKGIASTLCLNSEKSVSDRNTIEATISRDMDAIIEGKYDRNKDSACLRYCYTCHRSLPTWRFKPFTESSRLYSCEKCQGLANLGRERRDEQAVRLLMEDVRREEARQGGCSWIPYIMQEQDFVTLAKLWHNVSAVSGASCGLHFVRWEPSEEWSPWNTVLLTREEAAAHRIEAYGRDFVDTVRKRHLTAKWTFRNLIELERETRRKLGARDPKDNEAFSPEESDESNRRSRPSEMKRYGPCCHKDQRRLA